MSDSTPERPPIKLEPFPISPIVALRSATLVHQFVKSERDWLQELYPDIVQRYDMPFDARRNMLNLARSEQSRAYIVEGNGIHITALGLARVVFDQDMVHPELEKPVTGDRLSYLLKAGTPAGIHDAVVAELIERQGGRSAFALVDEAEPQAAEKAAALERFMVAVGEPATLRTTTPGDPFESAGHEGPKQIYQFVPGELEAA